MLTILLREEVRKLVVILKILASFFILSITFLGLIVVYVRKIKNYKNTELKEKLDTIKKEKNVNDNINKSNAILTIPYKL